MKYSKQFADKGYSLSKFSGSDTRRDDPASESFADHFRYYAALDGVLVEKFKRLADAGQWIQFHG